jgi:hypothetical protein
MKTMDFITAIIIAAIAAGTCFGAGELILNEFNAVGSEKYLEDDPYSASTNEDLYFA